MGEHLPTLRAAWDRARDRARHAAHMDDDGRDGFVAGAEALLLGSVVFVVGTILVINAWGVVDARMAADGVARQVARTLVEADPGLGLSSDLQGVADRVAGDLGRPGGVVLTYTDRDGSGASPASLLTRCAEVTVSATLTSTTIRLPFVGGWGSPWDVTGHHTEVVDPYRSGLPGEAACP